MNNQTLSRPTALGLAFWDAAHSMRRGSNTVLARNVRAAVNKNEQRYSVAMPAVSVHRIVSIPVVVPAELKGV